MTDKYILKEDGKPVLETDLVKWGQWHATSIKQRRVKQETVCGLMVSTVFLALDHNWSSKGPPILWETMVFDRNSESPSLDLDMDRCSGSREQAEAMHEKMVKKVKRQQQRKDRRER